MLSYKQKPEDFIVKEIIGLNIVSDPTAHCDYSYYLLTKTNYNTIDAVIIIAQKWELKPKYINFAGTKDRNAVTEQVISIWRGPKKNLYMDNITLKYLGQGNERINLGSLKANSFELFVESDKEPKNIHKIINYFDDQRFGINKNNHVVGKLLLKKNFKEACELIGLKAESNNYVGALKTLHKKTLMLFVHAYQSYLWNEIVRGFVKQNFSYYEIEYSLGKLYMPSVVDDIPQQKIPLIGFGTMEEELDGKIKDIIINIMKNEEITFADFIIREFPELSSEGGERNLLTEINELKIENLNEEKVNEEKGFFRSIFKNFLKKKDEIKIIKYKLTFSLDKGSYGTIVVKSLFG